MGSFFLPLNFLIFYLVISHVELASCHLLNSYVCSKRFLIDLYFFDEQLYYCKQEHFSLPSNTPFVFFLFYLLSRTYYCKIYLKTGKFVLFLTFI